MDKTEEKTRDLFEELRYQAQCQFISDMDGRRGATVAVQRARRAMAVLVLSKYSLEELQDVAHYLYGEAATFENALCAQAYFRKKLRESGGAAQ